MVSRAVGGLFLAMVGLGCGGSDPPGDGGGDAAPATTCTCVALTSDGAMSAIVLPTLAVSPAVRNSVATAAASLRGHDGRFYIIASDDDRIAIIDPDGWGNAGQLATGIGTYPVDIAVAGDRGYVAVRDDGVLQLWNLASQTQDLPVSLDSFDGDGNPDTLSTTIAGDHVYAAFAHLDAIGEPIGFGNVFALELPVEEFAGLTDLQTYLPTARLASQGADAITSTAGYGNVQDGCIERFTVGDPTAECVADNELLGGFASVVAVAGDGAIYAIVDTGAGTKLARVTAGGQLEAGPLTDPGQAPSDLAYCAVTQQLLYTDGNGVRVLDTRTGQEVTTAPISLGAAPLPRNALACL